MSTRAGNQLENAFDALTHVQRRTLLVALLEHNPQDDSPVEVTEEEDAIESLEQIVAMKHIHLPKLEAYGFIEWDDRHNEVAKGPNFEEIRPLLELVAEHEDELPDGWI